MYLCLHTNTFREAELNLIIAPSLVLESAPSSDLSLGAGWRASDHLSDVGSEATGSRDFLLSSPEHPTRHHCLPHLPLEMYGSLSGTW